MVEEQSCEGVVHVPKVCVSAPISPVHFAQRLAFAFNRSLGHVLAEYLMHPTANPKRLANDRIRPVDIERLLESSAGAYTESLRDIEERASQSAPGPEATTLIQLQP